MWAWCFFRAWRPLSFGSKAYLYFVGIRGKVTEAPVWAWCTFRAWRSHSLGRGAHSGSGVAEWEEAKNVSVGRVGVMHI